MQCVKNIIRTRGYFGLYTGTVMQAFRDIPGFTIYFLVYCQLQQITLAWGMDLFWSSFIGGAVGGAASWVVSTPFVSARIGFFVCGYLDSVDDSALWASREFVISTKFIWDGLTREPSPVILGC